MTYADVGGCKEQIEKLREVVELPLLEVCATTSPDHLIPISSYAARAIRESWYRASEGCPAIRPSRNRQNPLCSSSRQPDGQYLHPR